MKVITTKETKGVILVPAHLLEKVCSKCEIIDIEKVSAPSIEDYDFTLKAMDDYSVKVTQKDSSTGSVVEFFVTCETEDSMVACINAFNCLFDDDNLTGIEYEDLASLISKCKNQSLYFQAYDISDEKVCKALEEEHIQLNNGILLFTGDCDISKINPYLKKYQESEEGDILVCFVASEDNKKKLYLWND